MKTHYVNFGTAKTASTWIFDSLRQSDKIDYDGEKEPELTLFGSEQQYKEYFEKYNFSLNFNTNTWMLDSNQLDFIYSNATHRSIIFRNPYEFSNSLYNYWQTQYLDEDTFISSFYYNFDYTKILSRLGKDLKIFFYDDIVKNPQEVIDKITNYLEIPNIAALPGKVNVTVYKKNLKFTDKTVKLFNDKIDKFQDFVKYDLSHWKLNV